MKNVLYYFKEISKIPRETYHVEEITKYLIDFAKKNDLEYYTDSFNNVIIIKEASTNYEETPSIILQAHTDMVCQKTKDSNHNFRKDPIEIIEENNFLTANKTTLGADDGIGISMILSVLTSTEKMGRIEAVFTADEEVGMDGASNLDCTNLTSNYLINLDSEEEGILTAGCAGGVRLEVSLPIKKIEKKGKIKTITISNLQGGHSGVDINKNRVNAICFIGKILENEKLDLIEINGGKVDNAIPDNVTVKLLVDDNYNLNSLEKTIKEELKNNNELNAKVEIIEDDTKTKVITNSKEILNYISNIPNGVITYEEHLDDMVKTSSNIGTINTEENKIQIKHLIRSSNINEQDELAGRIKEKVKELNGEAIESSKYPGWQYDNDSKLRKLLEKIYYEQTNKKLKIEVIHAGLECGILKSKMPNLDCVSIGPNIYDVHTPNEKVEIKSIERTYNYLLEILKRLSEISK